MNTRRLKASATVEAAFIIPFTFFVSLALIVLIFRFYDRAKLSGDIRLALEYAREQKAVKGDLDKKEVSEYLREQMAEGYVFCELSAPLIEKESGRLKITVTITMRSALGSVLNGAADSLLTTTVSAQTDTEDREKKMRLIDAGSELLKKVVK